MSVRELHTIEEYEQQLGKGGIWVVDFYSTQCPPCKVIAPLYENIAAKPGNKDIEFFKVNGLEEPGLSVQKAAEVVWWPTLVVYDNGKETWRARVPNPPSLEPIRDLEELLDNRYVKQESQGD